MSLGEFSLEADESRVGLESKLLEPNTNISGNIPIEGV